MADWILNSTSSDETKKIPYQRAFPVSIDVSEYPNTSWKIDSSTSSTERKRIPYKLSFPKKQIVIDDAPNTVWILDSDSDDDSKIIPYKRSYSEMINYFDGAPNSLWVLSEGKTVPYKQSFVEMLDEPIMEERLLDPVRPSMYPDPIEKIVKPSPIDWTKPMLQRYEFYKVSPNTWQDTELLTTVSSASITRDLESDTRGSASFSINEFQGECYVRVYLVCTQGNEKDYKECLGTFLLQSPIKRYDGNRHLSTITAYTPLIELKEKYTPICYTINKTTDIVPLMYSALDTYMRAPVVENYEGAKLTDYDIIADTSDTWLSYVKSVLNQNKLSYKMDAKGMVYIYEPTPVDAMVPIWRYEDTDKSIIYKDISYSQDLYGVPNVYEVYISLQEGMGYVRVVNDDPNSPTSTVNRGREIVYRDTSPNIVGIPTQTELEAYAKRRLKELSTIEVEVSYTHAYCPVTIGDCVRIDYKAAGLTGIKAKVISQTYDLSVGCKVNEVAKFTTTLWR